jgi:hypothetical protein
MGNTEPDPPRNAEGGPEKHVPEPPCVQTSYRSGGHGIRRDLPNPLPGNDLGNPAQVSAAAGAAIDDISTPIDPRLAVVVEAWPRLPEAARVAILATVEAAGDGGEG